MRQRASLDMIAGDRAGEAEPEAALVHIEEDSRSTSSTSSPAPVDNDESDFFLAANDSQSSLGVPNLQDMQVLDDECLPPISRLPNEILMSIFGKLASPADLLHVMLSCKRWARNAVDLLWHRPSCSDWNKHQRICLTLQNEAPYFAYRDFIKRLNLAALHSKVNDGSVMPLAVCTRVERLTLSNCKGLTDNGLIALVQNNAHLLALDISSDVQITHESIYAIAEHCRKLQGLNMSGCTRISNESLVALAKNCRFIKRLKLNDCSQLNDEAAVAFAEHCPNILEMDLHQCKLIGNETVTALLARVNCLRELRLANCDNIDDAAFLSLPMGKTYEHLRILDLTLCARLTDRAVERIIDVAPRLRNLVLAKCRNITDAAVHAIARLGKNLHYVHLGHCGHITDDAVKRLVQSCNRIRYIDLGCCVHLTDDSVKRLANLPRLKRIGLVKCANITDDSVYELAKANQRVRTRRDHNGNLLPGEQYHSSSSLERVHLSYCTNLTLKSIMRLLNSCPRLTHLSLTGVQAFLREDLEQFCRDAPAEFTDHQRQVFCVFSGPGVVNLRHYLNSEHAFAALQELGQMGHANRNAAPTGFLAAGLSAIPAYPHPSVGAFDDGEAEADAVDDDDTLDDGSEMVVDVPPAGGHMAGHLQVNANGSGTLPIPVPLATPTGSPFGYVGGHPPYVPQQVRFHDDPMAFAQLIPPRPTAWDDEDEDGEVGDGMGPANPAPLEGWMPSARLDPRQAHASLAGPSSGATGPSTASAHGSPLFHFDDTPAQFGANRPSGPRLAPTADPSFTSAP